MTKKYTLNLLISEVERLSNAQAANVSALADSLSPRAGRRSAKLRVLNRFLGRGRLAHILAGTRKANVAGKTARNRLLAALYARKAGNN